MKSFIPIAITTVLAISNGYAADTNVANDTQRDANQQQRIEQGLQSGQLNTHEASKLEHQETTVDRMEKRDLRNGNISDGEQRRLTAAQNRVSNDIYAQKHDAQTGNPDSASSRRMQADVQRNANQQQRIAQGARSGSLTNRETGSLERGQARVNRRETNAAANGHIGAGEQARIQRSENRQSRRVFRKKHN